MTVTVYVDWEERRILNKEEFEMEVDILVKNINDDFREREVRIGDFLDCKKLDGIDLFEMSEDDRQALLKEFDKWLVEDAKTELLEECFSEAVIEL